MTMKVVCFLAALCALCHAGLDTIGPNKIASPKALNAAGFDLGELPIEQFTTYVDVAGAVSIIPYTGTAPAAVCLGSAVTVANANLQTCTCDATLNAVTQTANTFSEAASGRAAWSTLETEDSPRPLCDAAAADFTGFFVKMVYKCTSQTTCSDRTGYDSLLALMNIEERAQFQARFSKNSACSAVGDAVGVCYNPRAQANCAGTPYHPSASKCCSEGSTVDKPVFRGLDGRCPCTGNSVTRDVTTDVINGGDGNGFTKLNDQCPGSQKQCCLPTKYAEFQTEQTNKVSGWCFDDATERCCDTGSVYNPGEKQCCVINGVQSLDIPCPCASDAHCSGASVTTCQVDTATNTLTCNANQAQTNMKCCSQTSPTPEDNVFCSKYQSYPGFAQLSGIDSGAAYSGVQFGQGDARVQRCPGTCIDTRFQLCCNGASCVSEYEKCCNSTCCNKFVGSCQTGRRAGAPFSAEATYEQCTVVEQMSPLKAFRIFLLPAFLLLATLLSLALVLAFATKSTTRSFSLLEKCIVSLSVVALLVALPLFFSPAYKYGFVAVFAALIGVLAGSDVNKKLNLFAVVIVGLALLYFIDPFHGSQFLTFGSLRDEDGQTERMGAGVLHMMLQNYFPEMMKTNTKLFDTDTFCTEFYDYFRLDPQLLDNRFDNPEVTTFGYCSRGFTLTLTCFAIVEVAALIFLFVLALLGLISRFNKGEIELQVVQQ